MTAPDIQGPLRPSEAVDVHRFGAARVLPGRAALSRPTCWWCSDVESHSREKWLVSYEGKGLTADGVHSGGVIGS